ncbi:AICARFT/IMPCHase bienzyme family protein [Tanacetum coccineum]
MLNRNSQKKKVGGSKNALISLSDKKNLDLLAAGLQELGYTIVSTGGTASALEKAGISVTKVEELTNFPEMLDGRVKTLHPNVHGGILARRDQSHHMEALKKHSIGTFELVVVNLYPFYAKVSSASGVTFDDGIKNIDIGGPTMIRAAAKNHKDVLVVVDSEDYPVLLEFLKGNKDDQQFRRKLAWKAFQRCAAYDSAVSEWLWKQTEGDKFSPSFIVPLTLKSSLRYGENPHQKAAFYTDSSLSEVNGGGIATAIQHHGKEMSYNNYLDADAAWNCVSSRDAFNTEVDEALAKDIREFRSPTDCETRMFYEIVVAPSYSEKGLEILPQDSDDLTPEEIKYDAKSKKTPEESELSDAKFAWLCVKHVKSNAIVIATNNCMLGMGSGQPNRVDSLRIAVRKAGDEVKGAASASGAFFPFGNFITSLIATI